MSTTIFQYQVVEDNGGGLFFVGFDKQDKVVVVIENLEYLHEGELSQALCEIDENLSSGHNLDWEGRLDNPDEFYKGVLETDYCYEVVAKNYGSGRKMHTDVMGRAAEFAFGVDND